LESASERILKTGLHC